MRRSLLNFMVTLLVCSLALPATLLGSAARDDAKAPDTSTRVTSAVPAPPVMERAGLRTDGTFRTAIARTTSELLAADQGDARNPVARRVGTKTIRAQGGGKGQMITMLVGTVVGLASTVYMLKYLQKQQEKEQ